MATLQHLPPDKILLCCKLCGNYRIPLTDTWSKGADLTCRNAVCSVVKAYKRLGDLITPTHIIWVEECPRCFEQLNREEERRNEC
jgi:hypothetical protein